MAFRDHVERQASLGKLVLVATQVQLDHKASRGVRDLTANQVIGETLGILAHRVRLVELASLDSPEILASKVRAVHPALRASKERPDLLDQRASQVATVPS